MSASSIQARRFGEKGSGILSPEFEYKFVLPEDIEGRSFELIESELPFELPKREKPIIMRVIHTTADFDYCESLKFSENAVDLALEAIKAGALFITDTTMALSGINKPTLEKLGCRALCFMAEPETARLASEHGTTRAHASVDKAAELAANSDTPVIYTVGNAPTALIRICELYNEGRFSPALVIGAPVGFVNVVGSKEMLVDSGLPYITSLGRKGGSNVAAAICNALLYMASKKN